MEESEVINNKKIKAANKIKVTVYCELTVH